MKPLLALLLAAAGTVFAQTSAPSADDDQWLRAWVRELQFHDLVERSGSNAAPPAVMERRDNRTSASQTSPSSKNTPLASSQNAVTDWPAFWSRGQAQGKGPVRFTHLPMRVEDLKAFTPYGLMVGGHVCPIDHCYFYPQDLRSGQEHFDVMAPADGFIVVIGHRSQLNGNTERAREYDDYALTIEHSGTFYSQYDLLTSLDAFVLDQVDAALRGQLTSRAMMPQANVRIPVKAGQVIGKVGGRSLDFGVVNTETKLPGFLTPSLYGHYSWRVHLVDPFEVFVEPVRSRLLKFNARKVPPFGGRIDYDIDGRLIGNWFREGSGGYPGDRSDPRGYWMGHLAFAPHHIDPSKIVVSIGDFGGRPAQFWVKGNQPDPATIGEKDGMVKYEMIYGRLGSNGSTQEGIPTDVQGTVLAQVLPGRKLKFEAFPGQQGREVKSFTENAQTYER